MFDDLFTRHGKGKVLLELSFGKDSAACLWLLQPWWRELTIAWCNPGAPVPAALEYMAKVQKLVPNFEIVLGNQPKWIQDHGHPTDILPIEATRLGEVAGIGLMTLSFVGDCCAANMWRPMYEYVKDRGFTAVIRGQKLSDPMQGPIRHSEVIDEIEYFLPIADWSDLQVIEYLGKRLPQPYLEGVESSFDCANCTAYSHQRSGMQRYLDRHLPEVGREVRFIRNAIADLAERHVHLLREV